MILLLAASEDRLVWCVLYRRATDELAICEVQTHVWADAAYWLKRSLAAWRDLSLKRWSCCADQATLLLERLPGLLDHLTPGRHPTITAPSADLRMRLLRTHAGKGSLTDGLRLPGDPRPDDDPTPTPAHQTVGVQTALLSRA